MSNTLLSTHYGPLRFPARPFLGYVFPRNVDGFRRRPTGPPQALKREASRPIFPRALSPTTTGGPTGALTCCFPVSLSGFTIVGRLATSVFLTWPNRVYLRYGSRVRLSSSPAPLLESALVRLHVEQAIYMVNSSQFTRSARLVLAYRL
jgi:hypothetical protein